MELMRKTFKAASRCVSGCFAIEEFGFVAQTDFAYSIAERFKESLKD